MTKLFVEIYIDFIMIFTFIGSERPPFRKDYRYEQAFDSFYKLHTTAVTWHEARIWCEAEGSELIVPETLDEADSLTLLITPVYTKFKGVFIGIHDLYSKRWFVTLKGERTRDTIFDLLWESKEPIHSAGHCVALRRTGRMFVYPCNETLPFACKRKAADIKYYYECDSFDPRWNLGVNNTCYISHVEPQTWHQAHSTCMSAGGHLAILDSRAEAEYVRELFKQLPNSRTQDEFAFLGFSDLFQKYHYRTVLGQKLNETEVNWDFKCPGADDNDTLTDERCGGFKRSGLLTTAPCNVPAVFFCEKLVVKHTPVEESLRNKKEPKTKDKKYTKETIYMDYLSAYNNE